MRGVRDAPIMLGVVQPWSPGERLLIYIRDQAAANMDPRSFCNGGAAAVRA